MIQRIPYALSIVYLCLFPLILQAESDRQPSIIQQKNTAPWLTDVTWIEQSVDRVQKRSSYNEWLSYIPQTVSHWLEKNSLTPSIFKDAFINTHLIDTWNTCIDRSFFQRSENGLRFHRYLIAEHPAQNPAPSLSSDKPIDFPNWLLTGLILFDADDSSFGAYYRFLIPLDTSVPTNDPRRIQPFRQFMETMDTHYQRVEAAENDYRYFWEIKNNASAVSIYSCFVPQDDEMRLLIINTLVWNAL